MRRPAAHARGLVAAIAVATMLIVGGSLVGLGGALAYLLPPLLLVAVLLLRRYPGERALLALIARPSRRPRRGAGRVTLPSTPAGIALPRGGRLIASSLAVRPPPAPISASLG